MRRILLFLLVGVGSIALSSCLTIEERISLNSDGSGKQVTTVDMSGLLDNPFVKMAMAEEFDKEDNAVLSAKMDSSFMVASELLPLNPQWSSAEKELVNRVSGNIKMDVESGVGLVTTTFDFNSIEEIEKLTELLNNANKPAENEGNPLAGLSNGNFLLSSMMIKGTKFSRNTQKAPNFSNPLEENEELDAGMLSMMKEMFGDAAVIYQVDFPGKIKKVSGFDGHEVQDNSLIMMFDFMELMEDPEVAARALTGQVKFKN